MGAKDERIEDWINRLKNLGYTAQELDCASIKIIHFTLSEGWNKTNTDLVLRIPPNIKSKIHGILIPPDLKPIEGKKLIFPPSTNHNYTPQDWLLISFKLNNELHNEHYLENHMMFVKRVLSFKGA